MWYRPPCRYSYSATVLQMFLDSTSVEQQPADQPCAQSNTASALQQGPFTFSVGQIQNGGAECDKIKIL